MRSVLLAALRPFLALLGIAAATTLTTAAADVVPHALIGDGMVLQRERMVNLWGTAEPGEQVHVRFREQETTTKTDDEGHWLVRIESKHAGGPFPLAISGKNNIVLENVYVGEVWVCSGQSNMWWPVAARAGAKELAGTENKSIRLFTVPNRTSDRPEHDLDGRWYTCGPETLVGFSAVAYYFGREIAATQQVPVGLIHASVGGTGVQAWMSAQTLADDPALADARQRQAEFEKQAAANRERLRPEIERYLAALAQAKKAGTPPPQPPRGMVAAPSRKSQLYNGMIAPLQPFTMRGVIWYQGEANTAQARDYRALFSALIRGWRRAWNQGDFPFLFVQLAPYKKIVDEPQESDWARLREAQLQTSQHVPHTGMAVLTDWGHETDIHVKQKQHVGERLALLARALVYGEKVPYSGPLPTHWSFGEQQAVVTFQHVELGLAAKRMVLENFLNERVQGRGGSLHVAADQTSTMSIALTGFTVAGEDRRFYAARAEIRGDTVVVSSSQVPKPIAVRYGWADYPTGNLFNSAGLPASPFRTDDWEAVSPAVPPGGDRGVRGR
jgi:sialate O-acetylesterase